MSVDLRPAPSSAALALPVTESSPARVERVVTAVLVLAPLAALVFGVVWFWGRGVHVRDVILAVTLFFVVGHGITIGYHRLLAHKSFAACRPLKLVLTAAGSMAFQGGPIGWVANHRRHHVFADREQDPHTPHRFGRGVGGQLRGLWHAHVGWLFNHEPADSARHAADLLKDRDVVVINALFPMWCVASLAIPFGLGWLFGGGVGAALTALLWAGGVRIFVLQHVTWSINSLGHTLGRRPFETTDRSTNVAALALISMGESWHNGHHAFPRSARHGLLAGQWDTSALLIRGFERAGWVHDVHWPTPQAVRARASRTSALSRERLGG
jgi:stearoyl-CoA desaturase (delta-9 desaturase)